MIDKLSNYIIKAYKKRNGLLSFHLRSHLFIKTNTSFSVSSYLSQLESYFKLPNGDKVEFQICAFAREPTITFNGKFIVTEIRFSTVSEITKIKTCIVDLTVIYSLFGHPCIDPDEYRCKALVKFMY